MTRPTLPRAGIKTTPITGTAFRWADDFGGVALDLNTWEIIKDTGGIVPVISNSKMTVNLGLLADQELVLLSRDVFTIPMDLNLVSTINQRIAEALIRIDFVEVDSAGVPILNDNYANEYANRATIGFTGLLNNQVRVSTIAEMSGSKTETFATTIATTDQLIDYHLELRSKDVTISSALADDVTGRVATSGMISSNVPDPQKNYKLMMRFSTTATNPATNTIFTLYRVNVTDRTDISVEVTGGRGDSSAGRGMAVNVAKPIPAGNLLIGDVAIQMVAGRGTSFLVARLASAAATTNATVVKGSAARLAKVRGYNASAAVRYLKIYNKASTPNVGVDTPVLTLALPPAQVFDFDLLSLGLALTAGIGYALTVNAADNDTVALTAADVTGLNILYV